MKKQSDDVFERVSEGSLRLAPEAQFFRLTGFHWRDTPQLMLGLASTLILLTGVNLAYAAVFAKDLLTDKDRPDVQQEFQIAREAVANSEALMQAIRKDDQDAIERCKKKLEEFDERQKQRPAREAQRLAEHASAEKALRKRYGAAAAGLIVAGLSLIFVSRSCGRRGHRKLAEPSDPADSR